MREAATYAWAHAPHWHDVCIVPTTGEDLDMTDPKTPQLQPPSAYPQPSLLQVPDDNDLVLSLLAHMHRHFTSSADPFEGEVCFLPTAVWDVVVARARDLGWVAWRHGDHVLISHPAPTAIVAPLPHTKDHSHHD